MLTAMISYKIKVYVVDIKGQSDNADVYIILQDSEGNSSEKLVLHELLRGRLLQPCKRVYQADVNVSGTLYGGLKRLELWRDNSGFQTQWFVEKVTILNTEADDTFVFPVVKWIKSDTHYIFRRADCLCLPQEDELLDQRQFMLEDKQQDYIIDTSSLPHKITNLPNDEIFSKNYKMLVDYQGLEGKLLKLSRWTDEAWGKCEDIQTICLSLGKEDPQSISRWQEDAYFGYQRLAGCDPTHIRLCTAIPDKLAVTEDMLYPMLEGLTLQRVMQEKRLFIVDLSLLHHLRLNNGHVVCSPIALFFLNSKQDLMPIAIQLFQDPGLRNPVFFPTDCHSVWTQAKLWFNNAEAQLHLSLSHYGVCHVLMEGVTVMVHRHLSEAHPVFKLLASHFHLLLANNKGCRDNILREDGPLDTVTSCGTSGVNKIIERGLLFWRMDVQGTLPEDLNLREVDDSFVLPGYHYRDDGLLVYNVIASYVTEYVHLYYDCAQMIVDDFELQSWISALSIPGGEGGLEIKGVPGDGNVTTYGELVQILTCILFTCTGQHAAVGGHALSEHYLFQPGYPTVLMGAPPSDKGIRSDDAVLQSLPNQHTSAVAAVLGSNLCGRQLTHLGEQYLQYIADPSALEIHQRFHEKLEECSRTIQCRNQTRKLKYTYLDPKRIPNSPFT